MARYVHSVKDLDVVNSGMNTQKVKTNNYSFLLFLSYRVTVLFRSVTWYSVRY